MIGKLAEKIWWKIPYILRLKAIRFTQNKFTVSVVAVVTNDKREVLVLDHYFRPRFSWGLPGGFIDRSEAPEDAIRREIREETDLELEDLVLLTVRSTGSHIEIIFCAKGKGEAKVNSTEIRDLGWFNLNNLPEMSEVQKNLLEFVLNKRSPNTSSEATE